VDPVDEKRLVKLIAQGDRAAFEELYRRTSPWLAVTGVLAYAILGPRP
jgi:RNA polymerase sigma-70 factor, ECF subfamily